MEHNPLHTAEYAAAILVYDWLYILKYGLKYNTVCYVMLRYVFTLRYVMLCYILFHYIILYILVFFRCTKRGGVNARSGHIRFIWTGVPQ